MLPRLIYKFGPVFRRIRRRFGIKCMSADLLFAAYNKWHETELERWLSDHDVPYPTPADRKDLEKLVQKNWDSYVVSPYQEWDTDKLSAFLQQKGIETKDATKANKNSLVAQVQSAWFETEDKAQNAYISIKDWILDTWTDSQLKAFCDHHGIPGACFVRPLAQKT